MLVLLVIMVGTGTLYGCSRNDTAGITADSTAMPTRVPDVAATPDSSDRSEDSAPVTDPAAETDGTAETAEANETADIGIITDGTGDAGPDGIEDTIALVGTENGIVEEIIPVPLYINEVLATNTCCSKHNGRFFDMVELYNASDEAIALGGYYLSDSKKHTTDYRLPDIELEPGAFTVVYCTGAYYKSEDCDLPFKLSYFGEKLYLSDSEGNIIDSLRYPELPADTSFGRGEDGSGLIFTTPTLGEANGEGLNGITHVPAVDTEPGFCTEPVTVRFTGSDTVYYTLDGSKPTKSSTRWNGEDITIAHTGALRAFAVSEGKLDSFVITYNYFICEPEYELDTVMVSINESDFDAMTDNYRSSKKYPANIAMYSRDGLCFRADCGMTVFGCTSREYDKKSYRIKFSTDYGPSKLRYKVFDNLDIDEFDALVLRSGSQDAASAMLRDEFMSSLAVSDGNMTEVLVQAYHPVNLYVNGDYRGIYYLREHIDEDMIASHYGCEPEEVTLVEQSSETKSGDNAGEWKDMWSFLKSHHLDDPDNYAYVKSMVSLESVADYYILQIWSNNRDMDNVREFRTPDGIWRYALYDLDLALSQNVPGSAKYVLGSFNAGLYTLNALIYRLLENDEFRELFCERLAVLSGGVFNDDYAQQYLDSMVKTLEHDMKYNCARWEHISDSSGKISYRSFSGWENSVAYLRGLLEGRSADLVGDILKQQKYDDETIEKYFPSEGR